MERTDSELTIRAILSGLLAGSLIGASNVCIGLKVGWTFGTTITAAVLSFAFFRTIAPLLHRPFGARENLISTTAGSSAGTMATAAGLIAAIPALEWIMRERGEGPLSYWQLVIWGVAVAFLGVFIAVPLRRQMLLVERLPYPSGTAAAETIKAMHASGKEALKKAKILLYAALFAIAFKVIFSIQPIGLAPYEILSFDDFGLAGVGLLGIGFAALTIGVNLSPMMFGAGVLIGPRVGWSLFGGSVLAWAVLVPLLARAGLIEYAGGPSVYREAMRWILWPGAACMVTAGVTGLVMQYRTIGRTFASLRPGTEGKPAAGEDAPDPFPMKWWIPGMAAAACLTVLLAWIYFDIAPWLGLLAVLLSMLISAIAVRATGETDINPMGPMAKITQLLYGALDPGRIATNLMAAGITSAGASQAGDLMHDLKAGQILKVSIRRQVITQLIGAAGGILAAAGVYRLLTAAYEIPGETFAGPAVVAWQMMARVMSEGLSTIEPGALWGAAAGGLAGIVLILGQRIGPVAKWLPSPIALGIAFIVPAFYSASMWLGAVLFFVYRRKRPAAAGEYGPPLASGLIAGEGLMMVVIAILLVLGVGWV